MTSRLRIMRSNRQVQQAPSPGLNSGPTSGKAPEGCTSSQGVRVRHPLLVQFGQPPFEIVVDQRDRQIGRTIDDVNAEFAQGGGEFGRALDVDRFDAHAAIREILFGDVGWQAEARPISVHRAGGRAEAGTM